MKYMSPSKTTVPFNIEVVQWSCSRIIWSYAT